ncbi:acyltransferase family protein [Thermocrispum municipale]|jgi:peptidoglycan/LPS O-acetylase OafA/YrhL|uniref:acyltransferase family protein n=1 Tax=Thermocrispum municipale TaxID=37926 RepID=UPI000425424F|nr:acyltransferase [Thermocrispum municipale]
MTAPAGGKTRYYGLDLLRVLASLLVVYTHIAGWYSTRGHEWWASAWVDQDVIAPLHLNPNLSFVGVSTFLVVSGLVVTHVASRETAPQFLRRRLVRIFPLLLLVSLAAWILINIGVYTSESKQKSMDVLDLLTGSTLLGFFTDPEVIIIGPAWTLLVQIFFYAYVAATIPLLRRQAWIPPALAAALVIIVLGVTSHGEDVATRRFGIIAAYFPVLIIGMLVSLVRSGKVPMAAGVGIGSVHFLLFVWADRIGGHFHTGTEHPRTLALVFCVVVLAMASSDRVSRAKLTKAWSARTYAIYLLHPLCLYPMLDGLSPTLGTDLTLVLALLLLAAVTEIAHRFFEAPINRWVRAREKRADARPRVPAR